MARTPSRPSSYASSNGEFNASSGLRHSGRLRKAGSGIRFKICLCGKADVGKTSIFNRLQGRGFSLEKPKNDEPSQFEYLHPHDNSIEYSVWDTNGFEDRNSLTLGDHYRSAHCILLVYDVTDYSSLEYLEYEVEKIEKYKYAPCCKYILIQNKIDAALESQISKDEHFQFISNAKNIEEHVEEVFRMSAKDNIGINEFFMQEIPKLLHIASDDELEGPDNVKKDLFKRFFESPKHLRKKLSKRKAKKKNQCNQM